MIFLNSPIKTYKKFSQKPGFNARQENSHCPSLCTDFYQLSMLDAYYKQDMLETAVFEFFVRDLPPCRNFLVAAGLEQVIDYLQNLHFSSSELSYLKSLGKFDSKLINKLADFRFDGDVYAMPEGSIFFENEPIIQVVAPLPVAQFVESRIINIMHYQCMIASKAARFNIAAPGSLLLDFGMRRAHGHEAALYAARASYISGFHGTSMVEAGHRYNIPVFGTMAHSFVESHANELSAFINFSFARPLDLVLLIDTYDVRKAINNIVSMQPVLNKNCISINAVRIDSGNLKRVAKEVRKMLDQAGLPDIKILASGNLDEYKVQDCLAKQAPIDGFGIGTLMSTSADAPYLDCAYKLQEYAGIARRKRSTGKSTWPGAKQAFRQQAVNKKYLNDKIGLKDENVEGSPLLVKVMEAGERLVPADSLETIRIRFKENLAYLPDDLYSFNKHHNYPVTISSSIRTLAKEIDSVLK